MQDILLEPYGGKILKLPVGATTALTAMLAFGGGIGSELRHPLGVAMVGGLIFSQVLTLYTTPVIYIFFDNLGARFARHRGNGNGA